MAASTLDFRNLLCRVGRTDCDAPDRGVQLPTGSRRNGGTFPREHWYLHSDGQGQTAAATAGQQRAGRACATSMPHVCRFSAIGTTTNARPFAFGWGRGRGPFRV